MNGSTLPSTVGRGRLLGGLLRGLDIEGVLEETRGEPKSAPLLSFGKVFRYRSEAIQVPATGGRGRDELLPHAQQRALVVQKGVELPIDLAQHAVRLPYQGDGVRRGPARSL